MTRASSWILVTVLKRNGHGGSGNSMFGQLISQGPWDESLVSGEALSGGTGNLLEAVTIGRSLGHGGGTPLKGMGYRKLASSPFTLPSTLWCKWIPLALIPDLQSGVQTNVTTLSWTGTSRTNSQDINFLSFMVNCFRSFATVKWNWLILVVYSNDKALREKSQSSKPGSLVT